MNTKTVNSKLVKKVVVSPGVKSFFFKPEEDFNYIAGQYAVVSFKHNNREYSKHFTISNSPSRENIEMTMMMSGSDYKNALDSLQVGDAVSLKGPFGKFTLDALKEETVIFLAGGIGITPIKSMMEYAADHSLQLKGRLFYSNRTAEKIAFGKELKELAAKLGDFEVVNTLTRVEGEEAASWKEEKGHINADMIKRNYKEYSSSRFYIAGPPAFNNAAKKVVAEELKMPSDLITLEDFTGY